MFLSSAAVTSTVSYAEKPSCSPVLRCDTGRSLTGLLPAAADPLAAVMDSDLRGELMRCGHFAAACPDAFQGDVSSLRLGTCIYPWTQLAIGQQDAEMNKVPLPSGT